jgi:hypothetical protein
MFRSGSRITVIDENMIDEVKFLQVRDKLNFWAERNVTRGIQLDSMLEVSISCSFSTHILCGYLRR